MTPCIQGRYRTRGGLRPSRVDVAAACEVEVHAVREVVHEAALAVEVTERPMVALLLRRHPVPGPTTRVLLPSLVLHRQLNGV